MNGEMFFDLRRADLQDLFPSAEEFSFRKKIFDLLEDVVRLPNMKSSLCLRRPTAVKTSLSLAFTQNFANDAEDLAKKT